MKQNMHVLEIGVQTGGRCTLKSKGCLFLFCFSPLLKYKNNSVQASYNDRFGTLKTIVFIQMGRKSSSCRMVSVVSHLVGENPSN